MPEAPTLAPSSARRAIAVLCLLAMALTALPAVAASPEEDRIAATRAQLQAVRDELESARSDAEGDQIALEDADRQLQAAFDAVEAASQAVARQQEAVADAEARLAEARAELAQQRELMGERVARLYRQARPDDVIQVLGANSVTQAVRQSAYMSAIGREDRAAVETLANAERRVVAEEQALEAEEVALGNVLTEQEALLAEVEEIRTDRAVVAAASPELVAQLEARENPLESEAEELARIARERGAAAAAAARAAQQREPQAAAGGSGGGSSSGGSGSSGSGGGSSDGGGADDDGGADEPQAAPAPPPPSGGGFSWPASGSVTSEFGPRWGRMHEGIDIASGTGTPIAAAKGGSVIHAGPLGGYGNLVLVAHGGGFVTAYAHLSEIAVSSGQSVSTGTYLGGMGCTGSCTGTHLHFEIRANGVPVDPRSYL